MGKRDKYGPLGNISRGIRRVRPGGTLLFDRHAYYHQRLLDFIGKDVHVTATDVWVSWQVIVREIASNTFICNAELQEQPESIL